MENNLLSREQVKFLQQRADELKIKPGQRKYLNMVAKDKHLDANTKFLTLSNYLNVPNTIPSIAPIHVIKGNTDKIISPSPTQPISPTQQVNLSQQQANAQSSDNRGIFDADPFYQNDSQRPSASTIPASAPIAKQQSVYQPIGRHQARIVSTNNNKVYNASKTPVAAMNESFINGSQESTTLPNQQSSDQPFTLKYIPPEDNNGRYQVVDNDNQFVPMNHLDKDKQVDNPVSEQELIRKTNQSNVKFLFGLWIFVGLATLAFGFLTYFYSQDFLIILIICSALLGLTLLILIFNMTKNKEVIQPNNQLASSEKE